MMTRLPLVIVIASVLPVARANADTPAAASSDDAVVHALEKRNAERSKGFDVEARAAQAKMQTTQHDVTATEQANAASDTREAEAYKDEMVAAHTHANRKTALLLTAIAAAVAGGGLLTYQWANHDEAMIQSGGFATSSDIQSTADQVNIKQGVAFGAWGAAGVLTSIAIGFAW